MKTALTLVCILSTALAPAFALSWTVADNGEATCYATGAGDGRNHTVHNNGVDSSVTPTAYNAGGSWTSDGTIGVGNDLVIFVPVGGSLKVLDNDDEDEDGASGTYN